MLGMLWQAQRAEAGPDNDADKYVLGVSDLQALSNVMQWTEESQGNGSSYTSAYVFVFTLHGGEEVALSSLLPVMQITRLNQKEMVAETGQAAQSGGNRS